jgi:hypothetical protein
LKDDPEYPIYAVEVAKDCIAVGGGNEGGFVGIPLFLFTYKAETKPQGSGTSQIVREGTKEEWDNAAPVVQDKDIPPPDEEAKTTQDNAAPVVQDKDIPPPDEEAKTTQ